MKINKIIILVFAGVLCGVVQASMMTVTITGTGSGILNGVSFSNKMFEWALTYDPTSYAAPWGESQPIFLNPASVLTLQGVSDPISVTLEHGLYANKGSVNTFYIAPIRMTGSSPGGNILSVGGTLGWDTVSSFTSSSITTAGFNQFNNISTDQGLLTISSGSVSSVVAAAAIPEPASALLIGLGGALIALVRRFYGKA